MSQDHSFKLTPMYEQYLGIKKQYPDTILFYRMGDFYELFFEDAVTTAKELQLTLTSRSKDDKVPMCGIPWHAAENYFSQMLEKGYKVAICDQVEDPKSAKGLVKREVTRILTAGTAVNDSNLQPKQHNYLAALHVSENGGGLAWLDASTGYWTGVQSQKESELWQWVYKIEPKELLLPSHIKAPEVLKLNNQIQIVYLGQQSHFDEKRGIERILQAQKVKDLGALGLDKKTELIKVCGALLAYLEQNQRCAPSYLSPFQPLDTSTQMLLDEVTEKNLELFRRYDGKKGLGTLWHELDECLTPMGGRLLEESLRYPLKDIEKINKHQDVVEHFYLEQKKCKSLREKLGLIYDLERLSTKININRFLPKDFIALRDSLVYLPQVFEILTENSKQILTDDDLKGNNLPLSLGKLVKQWDNLADLSELLNSALQDNLPIHLTEGMLFKFGYNQELDELIDMVEHGETKLANLLAHEQEKSQLPKLKLGYNRVFGYYFELSKSQQQNIPPHFERRQSLVNAERFITPELKELEEKILSASEKRNSLEYNLFQDLRNLVAMERPRLLFMANIIAQLDFWQALGFCAHKKGWSKPILDESNDLEIRDGRHPSVEAVLGRSRFISNDVLLNETRRLLIITGPNMAGKSTILRQIAIICILAQLGSFVPASYARIGIVDRVFSRVGASDNLAQGQSTFMVEMMETARILRQSTKRSLVILDEIGRGTSTFDGLSLALAVAEDLVKRSKGSIRTLFATHYHEITALEGKLPGVYNMSIGIKEWKNELIFLHKLIPGPTDKSYGIEVARLAGVPLPVVQRAKEVLASLEENRKKSNYRVERGLLPGIEIKEKSTSTPPKIQEHDILKELIELNVNALSPIEGLKLIAGWQSLLQREKS